MFDFTGIVIKVSPIIPVTGKFKEKCTFVVREERGEREIAFLLFDSQIETFMKPLEIGDKVKVTFSVKSREYQGSYTTNCFALNVEKLKGKQEQYSNRSSSGSSSNYGDSSDRRDGKFNSGGNDWQEFKRKQEEKKRAEEERQKQKAKEEYEERQRRYRQQEQAQYKAPPTYHDYFSGIRTSDDAKKRYRELCKQFHPDKPGGSTEKMQEINKQYDRWR